MSHNFLLEIYSYINKRTDELEKNFEGTTSHYDKGCQDALTNLSTYMIEHYNIKLPKRLQKQLKSLAPKT